MNKVKDNQQPIKMSHTLFISDLHLELNNPTITECFLRFLKEQAPHADALYILGDFFEVWIGDDEQTPFQQQIIQALKQLTGTGLPVYFMGGNRDFLIGERFIKETGCRFLPDPSVVTLYGQPVLLAHGDALCVKDAAHQTFRKYTQNPRYQPLFLCLPLFIRRFIARIIRRSSQKHTSKTDYRIMDVVESVVLDQMRQYKVTEMIHGHTHRPDIHQFVVDGVEASRIVLPAWHDQGGALVWDDKDHKELIYFK